MIDGPVPTRRFAGLTQEQAEIGVDGAAEDECEAKVLGLLPQENIEMNGENMSATAIEETENASGTTMNAIILYDEFNLATEAKARLEGAMERTNDTTQWNVKPWRVDMLKLPAAAETAQAKAIDAHLIVLAVRHTEHLPAGLLDWLRRWADCRQVQDAALTVWEDERSGPLSTGTAPGLSQFAERHGLSFIFKDHISVKGEFSMAAGDRNERNVAAPTSKLPGTLEQARRGYQNWGINE